MSSKASIIRQLHLLSSSLFTEDDMAVLYWPVEISHFSFSALTVTPLASGQKLRLISDETITDLVVCDVEEHYQDTGYSLIKLISAEMKATVNLEETLRLVPELRRWNANDLTSDAIKLPLANLKVRAARFNTDDHLQVHARTFGTRGDFILYTENVSKSGMLLREAGEPAPFSLNTILELTIDPTMAVLSQPVRCLAKIVRHERLATSAHYGIHLIDMDINTRDMWAKYVEELERDLLVERFFISR